MFNILGPALENVQDIKSLLIKQAPDISNIFENGFQNYRTFYEARTWFIEHFIEWIPDILNIL
jgi:hypothetical protein